MPLDLLKRPPADRRGHPQGRLLTGWFLVRVQTGEPPDLHVDLSAANAARAKARHPQERSGRNPVTTTNVEINFSGGQRTVSHGVAISHAIDGDSFTVTNENSATSSTTVIRGESDATAGTYVVRVRAAIGAASRGTLLFSLGVQTGETLGPSSANVGLTADYTPNDFQYRVGYPLWLSAPVAEHCRFWFEAGRGSEPAPHKVVRAGR
jgi:hypothetical protein